jgi:cbb3-type cytochrome oxidase cytochrome c subunit
MAATDKPFRDQRTLDLVFAVSNILMLLSLIWMFWQDYAREYKDEQRAFRQVEVAVAQQQAVNQVPDEDTFNKALEQVKEARKYREDKSKELDKARADRLALQPKKERTEAAYQSVKADVDSITSFLDQAREFNDSELTKKYSKELEGLYEKLAKVQADRDAVVDEIKLEQFKIDDIDGRYTIATAAFKKVNDKLDAQVKLALTKRWTLADWVRTMPVINGFADPLKINQFTINDIPIDYNFKYVTRFDRCTSCHLGIDRPNFSRENLIALTKDNPDFAAKLKSAQNLYDIRIGKEKAGQDENGKPLLDPDDIAKIKKTNPHDIVLADVKSTLNKSRITEFAAHPRLDLYVGSSSKHPAEKFGCSSCHYGQGSGTSFLDASHTPNNSSMREEWTKGRGWEPNHMWDFPMLPNRFVESSCIKCHHEVTDLVGSDNRLEAPKLLKGYNLIKENGCFGCHEISGWKGINRVGPDLRLEPNPPLENLLPIERVKAENDPDNRPGTMRKVGPALNRVSEKLSEDWIQKWVRSPSSFRPDTKMPHYYGLSTNDKRFLHDNAPDQEKFPDAEITSIAYFLTRTSKDYLKSAEKQHAEDRQNPEKARKDETRLIELLNLPRMDKEEQAEASALKARMKYRKEVKLVDLAPGYTGNAEQGRVLFTEKGCLACHTHDGTNLADPKNLVPTIKSDATFGPNLSDIAAKLVPNALDNPGQREAARKWLIQWIVDPHVHSPRSRMPVTHLTPHEAADIAAWLFNPGPVPGVSEAFAEKVPEPAKNELHALAKVYLTRMLSERDLKTFLAGMSDEQLAKFRKDSKDVSDEWRLILNDVAEDEKTLLVNDVKSEDSLKFYLGKKAVGRLGCYGCHDIPGFEAAKPIGVALNDWGKKPADRLAFEDIKNFFNQHYYPVDSLTDKDGKALHGEKMEEGHKKEPYEKFYANALPILGHNADRIGYLNQKLRDPRSYDFNRIRTWDDRSRMPKFAFSRPRKGPDENEDDFKKRILVEEARDREAVATFILGLVAEQVPVKSINQPKGDRLAEVKGRQILDKYNCAGCHLISPGVYDFKTSPKGLDLLDDAFVKEHKLLVDSGEIVFPNHRNWVGRPQLDPGRLLAFGVQPTFKKEMNEDVEESFMILRPSEALQFTGKDGKVKNIPAGKQFYVRIQDLQPPGVSIQSQQDLDRVFSAQNPYGGTFTNLLVPYLVRKDKKFKPIENDSDDARAVLPPPLIGEGEKVQADWLYSFLLDPPKVRRMPILRMPKFNMSKQEARILTDYFAAATRINNPGISPPGSHEFMRQHDDLDSPYWRKKTADYVTHLRETDATDKDGKTIKKDGKAIKAFDQRVAVYTPIWEQMLKDSEAGIKADIKRVEAVIEAKEEALKNEKDKKADLQKDIDAFKADKVALETSLKKLSLKSMQDDWEAKEAYIADAYRMLTSRDLCTKCHQVGNFRAGEQDKQGPPLDLAHARLRPEWITEWVNKPTRFVPYTSMTQYFNKDKPNYQQLQSGRALDQIHALRDVLMIYPRVAAMPVNRLHNPDAPADKK